MTAVSRLTPMGRWSLIAPRCGAKRAKLIATRSEDRQMARLVKHDETGPYEVPEGTELPAWICGCGLSKNKPFCDGSHKKTRDEGAGLFTYDGDQRTPVTK
jgi:CDGSH-type Zn-finger protein